MSDEDRKAFADHLAALRKQAGITQAELAERSGLHLGTVRKLENAQREPAWRVVCALARGLGVDLNTLGAYAVGDERTERPRGRPKKEPPEEPKSKRPRGRPRKEK